jgi:hypothetical protein
VSRGSVRAVPGDGVEPDRPEQLGAGPDELDGPRSGMVPVAMYDDASDAEQAAVALVARGIGAVVDELAPGSARPGDVPASVTARVLVLTTDLVRASEILGFDPPEWARELSTDGVTPREVGTPWRKILLLWLAAMILIPGLAFLLSYNLAR